MDTNEISRKITAQLEASAGLKLELARSHADAIAHLAQQISRSLCDGGKIILFGNGGSAADAQHIASELVGRFKLERPGLRAISLSTDTSLLTSIGNDFDFGQIFSRQIECLADPADLVIGITTSGDSRNILNGIEAADRLGATTICLTGMKGGACADAAQLSLVVPSDDVPRIQEAHITIGHILCDLVEEQLFGNDEA